MGDCRFHVSLPDWDHNNTFDNIVDFLDDKMRKIPFRSLKIPWELYGCASLQQSLDMVEFEVEIPHFVVFKVP